MARPTPWSARAPTFFIISPFCGRRPVCGPRTSGAKWSGASICSELPRSCRNPPSKCPRHRRLGSHGDQLSRLRTAICASATNASPDFSNSRHGQIRGMVVHRAMLRRIYDWCIDAAHKPYALWILGAVAFAESSFFPIPPDVMLLPMSVARPRRAWLFATVCTAASVAGGVLGYAIGALLYDSVGQWLINLYGLGSKVETFRESYAQWGALIIIGKGLTPIPYKLVTITSGFAGYNIWLFVLCSIIARGGRFFVVAILLNRYGEWIRVRIESHLGLWVALGAAVLVAGFIVAVRML